MTPWQVLWTRSALRDMKNLDRPVAVRVHAALSRYAETGHGDIRKLQAVDDRWRLRVGEWRAEISLDYTSRVITVLRVSPRGSAYRD